MHDSADSRRSFPFAAQRRRAVRLHRHWSVRVFTTARRRWACGCVPDLAVTNEISLYIKSKEKKNSCGFTSTSTSKGRWGEGSFPERSTPEAESCHFCRFYLSSSQAQRKGCPTTGQKVCVSMECTLGFPLALSQRGHIVAGAAPSSGV